MSLHYLREWLRTIAQPKEIDPPERDTKFSPIVLVRILEGREGNGWSLDRDQKKETKKITRTGGELMCDLSRTNKKTLPAEMQA